MKTRLARAAAFLSLALSLSLSSQAPCPAHAEPPPPSPSPPPKGVLLETLTWPQAEARLTPEAVVVIPLGAAAKEHGPHLQLNNDFLMAEYLKRRVLFAADVVIAPTVSYSYYPAFVNYPGSTTVPLEAARDTVLSICRTLAAHGPKRFYILNTGISTVRALKQAHDAAAAEGITLYYFSLATLGPLEKALLKQPGGTHADEGETSMMLYMAPEAVDMKKAVKDYHPRTGDGPFQRVQGLPGIYSTSGTWGDATLATREKGQQLTEAAVRIILEEIEALRKSPRP